MRSNRSTAKRYRAVFPLLALIVLLAVPAFSHLLHAVQPSSEFQEATVVRVVDGDTLQVSLDGSEQKVRLIGIDAAESVNPDESKNTEKGREASAHLKSSLAEGTRIWLQKDVSDTDKYGRLLRYVWLDLPADGSERDPAEVESKMLNAQLVSQGWAKAKDFPPDSSYSDILASLGGNR